MHIIIIGAGLSGLSAAYHLEKKGHQITMIEATDRVGGRIKTDVVEGFRMDHGFQVLLTAYPEAQAMFDYDALDLKYFDPGAKLLMGKGLSRIGDPMRQWGSLFPTLLAPVGSVADKLKMLSLKRELKRCSVEDIFNKKESSTLKRLQVFGFSDRMIQSFFRPFFGGIFLENELSTSSRMFDFVFKMFSEGYAAIPAQGMEELPKQIAQKLKNTHFIFNQKVVDIQDTSVKTSSGESYQADAVLIATESNHFSQSYSHKIKKEYVSTTNLYFATDQAPWTQALIALNASGSGLINNCTVMSNTSAGYAPKGKHLISVSVNSWKEHIDPNTIKKELSKWMDTHDWSFLKSYPIRYALLRQKSISYVPNADAFQINENLYVCGDHQSNGSINAALLNGRLAAQFIDSKKPSKNKFSIFGK